MSRIQSDIFYPEDRQYMKIKTSFMFLIILCLFIYSTVDRLSTGVTSEPSSLKEEVFWLVAHMATIASNPALMVTSLMEFLRESNTIL